MSALTRSGIGVASWLLGAAALLLGCAPIQAETRRAISGVALDSRNVYAATRGSTLLVFELRERALHRVAEWRTPCVELLDVELARGELFVLCEDGRVGVAALTSQASGVAELGPWRPLQLDEPHGRAVSLERSDGAISRLEQKDPPRTGTGIVLDGPGPSYRFTRVDRPGPFSTDRWNDWSDRGPASTNATGDAFVFTTKLWRGAGLSIMSAHGGNASCTFDDRAFSWLFEVSVDAGGRRVAALSEQGLVVVELGEDGSLRATAVDPETGARLRGWGRCHR